LKLTNKRNNLMKRTTRTAEQAHHLYKLNRNLSNINESKLNSLVEHALKDLLSEQQTPTNNLEGNDWVSATFANAFKLPNNLTLNSSKQEWQTYFNKAVGSKYGSLMRQDASDAYNALMKRYNQQVTMKSVAGSGIKKPTTQNLSNEVEVKKYIQSLIKSGAISNFKEWENKAKQINSIHDTNKVDALTRQLKDSRGFPIFTPQQSVDAAGRVTTKSVIPGFNTSDIILFQRIFSKYWRLTLLPENEQAKLNAFQIPGAPWWADAALELVIDFLLPPLGVAAFSAEVISGISDFFQSESGMALTRAFDTFRNLPELPTEPNYNISFKPVGPLNVVTNIKIDGSKFAAAIAGSNLNESISKPNNINELRAWHEDNTLYVKVEPGDYGKMAMSDDGTEVALEQIKANMMWSQMANALHKMYPDISIEEGELIAGQWTKEWNSTFGAKENTYKVSIGKLSELTKQYNALQSDEDKEEFLKIVTTRINAADLAYSWIMNDIDYIDAIRLGLDLFISAPGIIAEALLLKIANEFEKNSGKIILWFSGIVVTLLLGKLFGINQKIFTAIKYVINLLISLLDTVVSKLVKYSGELKNKLLDIAGNLNRPIKNSVDDIILYVNEYSELVKLASAGAGPRNVRNLEFMKKTGLKNIDDLVKRYGLDKLEVKNVAKETTSKLFNRTKAEFATYFSKYNKYQQRLFNVVRDDKFIDVLLASTDENIRKYASRLVSAAAKSGDIRSAIIKRGIDAKKAEEVLKNVAKKTADLSRKSAANRAAKQQASALQRAQSTTGGSNITYTTGN